MTLSMVTYADLGSMENNKTPGALPILKRFSGEGQLKQVICRRAKKPPFSDVNTALPAPAHWLIGGLGRVLPHSFNFPKRRLEEAVYDWQAAEKLTSADVTLFHPPRFPRAIKVAKEHESILAGIGTIGHQAYTGRLKREELEKYGVTPREKERWWQWWGDFAEHYQDFDYIFALSEFVKETFIASGYPAERIFITPTDIDTEKYSPPENKKEGLTDGFDVVFMASSLWLLKGLQYLLAAWQKLDIPNARLHVFGQFVNIPSELRKKMEAQISRDDSIIRYGVVDNPEHYLKRADLLVQPSLNEGLSKVLLEAMACGLPTISTEHSRGIVEDGESGLVVPIRDSQVIAQKITLLHEDASLRDMLGASARQAILDKPSYAEAVWQAYNEICRREDIAM